jgi:hypothetical protein
MSTACNLRDGSFSVDRLYWFQCLSSLFLKEFRDGADMTHSGREFHLLTDRKEKKLCLTDFLEYDVLSLSE